MITVGKADLSALVSKAVIESTQIQVKTIKYTSDKGSKVIGFEMTLGDGTRIKAGRETTSTVQLPENLYKIETILTTDENEIYQIKFSGSSGVITIGKTDTTGKYGPGRVETFNLAEGEELIGSKLYYETAWTELRGLEWIKWRPPT